MASIRRTLSPVPRREISLGEANLAGSPLSKSSSCTQNYTQPPRGLLFSLFGSPESHLALFLGIYSQRSSRSKSKGHNWKRTFCQFFICFVVGIFFGFTPFISNSSINLMSKHQVFSYDANDILLKNISNHEKSELRNDQFTSSIFTEKIFNESGKAYQKLLIVVTPTYPRPFQAYYLNRMVNVLLRIRPPLLWVVVEMHSQSAETADLLRRTGVMYRHLVCNENITNMKENFVHQRNAALSHIEMHRLDGTVYFADDENIYSVELFEQMRQIRRLGTWTVAKITETKTKAILQGPVCNGTEVLGWYTNDDLPRTFRRFHAELSGFAFNSTILWDTNRWHRPTLELIRMHDNVKEGFQVSTFIEQIVEDESQMECLSPGFSRIMVWNLHLESPYSLYPSDWVMKNNLDVVGQLT